jgi:hypothetical protein
MRAQGIGGICRFWSLGRISLAGARLRRCRRTERVFSTTVDQPEREDENALDYLGPAGSRTDRFTTVDLIDCCDFHLALLVSREAGQPRPPPGDAPANDVL